MKRTKHYNRFNNRALLAQLRGADKDFLTLQLMEGKGYGARSVENTLNPTWREAYWATFNELMSCLSYGAEKSSILNEVLIPYFIAKGVIY